MPSIFRKSVCEKWEQEPHERAKFEVAQEIAACGFRYGLGPTSAPRLGLARHVEDGGKNPRERRQGREPVHAIFLVATMRP